MFLLRLVLVFRATSIFPLILKTDDFHDHSSNCEKMIFSGGPLISFLLAAMVSVYHWHFVDTVTISRSKISLIIVLFSQFAFWYFTLIFIAGTVLYCSSINSSSLSDLFLYLQLQFHMQLCTDFSQLLVCLYYSRL